MTATLENKNLCARCVACNRRLFNCPFCTHSFTYENRNVVINKHKSFTEIILYHKPFPVLIAPTLKKADRTPNWHYVASFSGKELLVPKNDNIKLKKLICTLEKSRKHSEDCFFGFAFNNTWNYFITLTFDPKKVRREDEASVKYAWKLFRQKLQYLYPQVKILMVIEKHPTSEGLHMHGLLGDCNLESVLVRALNNKKYIDDSTLPNPMYLKPMSTSFGDPLYNFIPDFYSLGFTSIVKLRDNEHGNEKMVQYMQKYMTKEQSATRYHKKSYFRTSNLDYKDKFCTYLTEEQFRELFKGRDVTIKKDNPNMFVAVLRD